MTDFTRRDAMTGAAAFTGAALTTGSAAAATAAEIERDVLRAENRLYATVDGARELAARARGMLIMPDVIKGGLIVGGAYGEGALKIGGVVDGFYSVAAASVGYQIGVQKTSHVLFFMTQKALDGFIGSQGWELGADAEFTVPGDGISLNLDTTTIKSPIIAIVFAQDGLLVGASLAGSKYSRITR